MSEDENVPTWDDLKKVYGWVAEPTAECPRCGKATAFDLPPKLLEETSTFKAKEGSDEETKCPPPIPPEPQKDAGTIADLLKAVGADQACIKESDQFSDQTSGSMRAKADAFIASVEAEAKFGTSSIADKKKQVGCGTLLVTSTNIIQKKNLMQCIIESCKQDQKISVRQGATISISTLPLTPEEAVQKAQLLEKQTLANIQAEEKQNKLYKDALLAGADAQKLEALTEYLDKATSLRINAQNEQLKLYSRDINIADSKITVNVSTQISSKVSLTADASNKLSKLSQDISKDIAQMTVANELGVNAQDPNLQNIINRNSESTDNTSSSSIANMSQNTEVSLDAQGNVVITAPGVVNIKNTTIDVNMCASVIVEQIMNRSIASGLELASKTINDTSSVQDVLNKVRGLDDMQKALNDGIRAGTENTMSQSGNKSLIIGAIVIFVVILLLGGGFFLMNGGKGGSTIVMPSYKFDVNFSEPQNAMLCMIGFFILLFLVLLVLVSLMPPKNKEYTRLKRQCEQQGERLCSSDELCNQVKQEKLTGVNYSPVSNGNNHWLQYNNGVCKQHYQNPPVDQRVVSRCCPVHGTPNPTR